MQTYFKVGQTVYCAVYGEGVVEKILNSDSTYPVIVIFPFDNHRNFANYTRDGRLYELGLITLSQTPIPPIVNNPVVEYNLSFAQALEAVANGKVAQKEGWIRLGLKGQDEVVKLIDLKYSYVENYITCLEDVAAKWRIVE